MRRGPDERVLFALLGVDETASWDEVRRAFRDAVRASHPDLHAGDPDGEARLKALNAAWELVNTPSRWAAYVDSSPAASGGSGTGSPAAMVASLGRLKVQRQRSGSAGLRRWGIELDGDLVASIANGDTTVLHAGPGPHSLRVFYEWYSSAPMDIRVRAGYELHLGCRQHPNPLRSLTSPKRSLLLEHLDTRRFA